MSPKVRFSAAVMIVAIVLALPIYLSGCGKAVSELSPGIAHSQTPGQTTPVTREQRLLTLDHSFAAIHDKDSAESAIQMVADRAYGLQGSISTQSSGGLHLLTVDLKEKLAVRELKARGITEGLSPSELDGEGGVTPEKVTESINAAVGVPVIQASQVEETQAALRQEMPHLRGVDPTQITPVGALLGAYVMATGDAGELPDGAHKDVLSDEKVNIFLNTLTE